MAHAAASARVCSNRSPSRSAARVLVLWIGTSAVVASRLPDGGATWQPTQTLIWILPRRFLQRQTVGHGRPSHRRERLWGVGPVPTSMNTGPTYIGAQLRPGRYMANATVDLRSRRKQTDDHATLLPFFPMAYHRSVRGSRFDVSNRISHRRFASFGRRDSGASWSAPISIAENLSVGTHDPQTGTIVRDSSLIPEIAVAPDGDLFVTWQDARFNGGAHDGVVLSRSGDGGVTWSAPVQINADASVPAFSPNVRVLPNGTIGVSYYDFRPNTNDASTLLTDYWLTVFGGRDDMQTNIKSPVHSTSHLRH